MLFVWTDLFYQDVWNNWVDLFAAIMISERMTKRFSATAKVAMQKYALRHHKISLTMFFKICFNCYFISSLHPFTKIAIRLSCGFLLSLQPVSFKTLDKKQLLWLDCIKLYYCLSQCRFETCICTLLQA